MNRKYSIVIVTLNNAEGLQKTLQSIAALCYKHYEVIVIDGKSIDSTADVVKQYGALVTVFVSESDSGIYNAMNKSLRYITGDYVVFMNAGDCFAKSDTLDIVNKAEADLILGGTTYGGDVRIPPARMTLYDLLAVGINHQSTYYRKDVLMKYPFDERLKIIADMKTVCEPVARDRASVACITEILSICEGGGLSKKRWIQAGEEKIQMVNDILDPFYRDDYLRFLHVNRQLLPQFAVISKFTSVFPLIRGVAKMLALLNKYVKKMPLPELQ